MYGRARHIIDSATDNFHYRVKCEGYDVLSNTAQSISVEGLDDPNAETVIVRIPVMNIAYEEVWSWEFHIAHTI